MIDELVHIQIIHQDLPISERAMTTSALTTYLYGARKVVEASRRHRNRETGQQRIQKFFQPRRPIGTEQNNRITAIIHHNI
jgi:hypothetical protein